MILENIKKDKFFLLRVLMGLVFLGAAIYRLFNPALAILEFSDLQLPIFLVWPSVVAEIIGGICLLFNYKVKILSLFMLIFLVLALLQALVVNGASIWQEFRVLFIFKANAVDWFLHVVFVMILGSIFLSLKK